MANNGHDFNIFTDGSKIEGKIDQEMFSKVMGYIKAGKEQGARCVAGGDRVGKVGFFIQPTVFVDVKEDMKIAREEIFGPVQSIFKFDTFEEVVDRANDSNYGLGAGVITKDRYMSEIDYNVSEVNPNVIDAKIHPGWMNGSIHMNISQPKHHSEDLRNLALAVNYGGEKGILQYLENKTVTVGLPKQPAF